MAVRPISSTPGNAWRREPSDRVSVSEDRVSHRTVSGVSWAVSLLGILKAIGASGTFLATQGLLQVFLVTLGGALISVGLALLTEATLLSSDTVPIMFTTDALLTSALSVVAGGLVGAALSVRQVAAIDPIIAMQQQ